MDPVVVTAWATSISAIGVAASAFSASRSASAAKRAVDIQASAALLGSIPIVVPWLDQNANATAMNRGSSVALNLEWTIEGPDIPGHEDRKGTVLGPGKHVGLNDPRSALKTHFSAARNGQGLTITCDYTSAWGERFRVVRLIGERHGPAVLYGENGKRISVSIEPSKADGPVSLVGRLTGRWRGRPIARD